MLNTNQNEKVSASDTQTGKRGVRSAVFFLTGREYAVPVADTSSEQDRIIKKYEASNDKP